MSTNNLGMDTVPSNSLQPSVPINSALTDIDACLAATVSVEFTTDANLTLTEAQYLTSVLLLNDSPPTLTTGRDVIFPAHFPAVYVKNNTLQTLTLKKSGQSGSALAAGAEAIVYSGATDVVKFSGGGGVGTVTSVDASGGVQTASGTPITSTGTIRGAHVINAQTGTSYAILTGDRGKNVTLNNAASIAATIAQAGTAGFEDGWFTQLEVTGAGTVTLTPTTSTINGASTLVLNSGMAAFLFSDGANYRAIVLDRAGISVNAQTGTSYTYLSGDRGKLVTHTNGSAIAATLPQATGAFGSAWFMWVQNRGAGTVTITPTTSTIDGAASLALTTNQGCLIASDGTNYYTVRGIGSGGGGSLTNWTEAVSTAAPNATIPAVSLAVTNAATSVDACIIPKGASGAFLLAVPDNTTTGGNKRGSKSVDLQTSRSVNSQVASGAMAFIGGGQDNAATNTFSSVVNGSSSTASAGYAFAHGQSCTASGTNSTATGRSTTANGPYSYATGYGGGSLGMHGARAHTATAGNDRQWLDLVVSKTTLDATIGTLSSDTVSTGAVFELSLVSGSALAVKGIVVARQSAGSAGTVGDCKAWTFDALIKNIGGTTSLVAAVAPTVTAADAGAAAWTLTVTADNGSDLLRLQGTGEANKTIRWTGHLYSVSS